MRAARCIQEDRGRIRATMDVQASVELPRFSIGLLFRQRCFAKNTPIHREPVTFFILCEIESIVETRPICTETLRKSTLLSHRSTFDSYEDFEFTQTNLIHDRTNSRTVHRFRERVWFVRERIRAFEPISSNLYGTPVNLDLTTYPRRAFFRICLNLTSQVVYASNR